MSEAKNMKIVQGLLLEVLAGVFVIGFLQQVIGEGLATMTVRFYDRLEEN
jgi:hypothetical protein